jgi:hypothetical protein
MTAEAIVETVTQHFLRTGEPIRIHVVAQIHKTSAAAVRRALDAQRNGFDFFEVDLWTGSSFCGKFVRSWAVEPSKRTLRGLCNAGATA